ncbi:MAG: Mg-protoporphyrin IX monomethyl ester oxidative cyclase [Chloroflexota bacterium]|nr:MAG: Mg-protoporphyrin IX monomethyl ester oxidative cyclase [Chloroflexota bacterium]
MTDVLFGQSYYLRFDPKLWEAMQPYPPLGSLYAASYIRQQGYTVALFDAMLAESEAEWVAALDQHQPKYAVLYEDSFNYLSKMCLLRMRQAAFTMAEAAKARGCTVIISGSDATDHAEKYFQHGVDYILMGEGELSLGELLDHLSGKAEHPLESILGLAWRFAGQIQRTAERPFVKDLDKFPFPAWDLVDVSRYEKIWRQHHGYYSMNMVTTRGCPYRCNWCAKPIYGRRYNSRSPENVVAELKWLKDNFKPDHIWFADDIFGLKPGWIEKFSQLAVEQDAVVPFKCLQRVDLITEEIAWALKRAGCKAVWVGAESGSQKILDAMDKDTQVEDIYTATERLHRAGVEMCFFLQFGYPGEGWDEIQQTLKMVRECKPDNIGISVSYPLPGTKFYENVKIQLGEKTNWLHSDDLDMLYRGPFVADFYRVLHHRVHHEYRARKAWRSVTRALQNPTTLRPAHLRQAATIPLNLARLVKSSAQLRRLAKVPHDDSIKLELQSVQ